MWDDSESASKNKIRTVTSWKVPEYANVKIAAIPWRVIERFSTCEISHPGTTIDCSPKISGDTAFPDPLESD